MRDQLTKAGYAFDSLVNIWARPGYASINYSDGDGVENRIREAIASATDVSIFSSELRGHCIDWPSTYHLSSSRANILRPFENQLVGKRVLEIGAGCGAVTRYLGEIGANVLALEGSRRRAAIARNRTRELKNIEVLSDNFDEFAAVGSFDFITLIGVLEYAPMFIRGENPALEMLKRARSMLAADGKLIIAIENKLGLKYFAGAPEDHTGEPMYGIESRYTGAQAKTFGREELEGLIQEAGFLGVETLAPFPDYKFPVSVVTPQGFSTPEFDLASLIQHSVDKDPQMPKIAAFSMQRAWPAVVANGLAQDLANSFLMVASIGGGLTCSSEVLAYHFNTNRVAAFCKEAAFCRRQDGIHLRYRLLSPAKKESANGLPIKMSIPETAPYRSGTLLGVLFSSLVTKEGWSIHDLGALLQQYADWVLRVAGATTAAPIDYGQDISIPGHLFDAIPFNIIVSSEGHWQLIDTEWVLKEDFSLRWLVFRALMSLLYATPDIKTSSSSFEPSHIGFIRAAFAALGCAVSNEELVRYWENEARIQSSVLGKPVRQLTWEPETALVRSTSIFEHVRLLELLLAQSGDQLRVGDCTASRIAGGPPRSSDVVLNSLMDSLRIERKALDDKVRNLESELLATHEAWRLRGDEIERRERVEKQLRREFAEQVSLCDRMVWTVRRKANGIIAKFRGLCLQLLRIRSVRGCGRIVVRSLRKARRIVSSMRVSLWLFHNRRLVSESGLFDPDYYKRENAGQIPEGSDLVTHYLLHGGYAGLQCSPLFDAASYFERYPDIRSAGFHPLLHYIKNGRQEGRRTTRHFAPDLFLDTPPSGFTPLPPSIPRGEVSQASLFIVYGPSHVDFLQNVFIPTVRAQVGWRPVDLHLVNYAENVAHFTSEQLSGSLSLRDWSVERGPGQIGFGDAHNFLFGKVQPRDAFVIVNPDSCPLPGCLDALYDTYAKTSAGIVEARQWPRSHPKEFDLATGNTPWASGAFSLIDSEVFAAIGGFDPVFFLYGEDVDLSWRVWLAGKRVVHAPKAICSHFTGLYSYRSDRFYFENFYSLRNFIVLARKFFGEQGERYAIRELHRCDLPVEFKQTILASYENLRPSIATILARHPMIKILGMNLYHLFQPPHTVTQSSQEHIVVEEAIAHVG
jgi:2-polyprenyl-3-methyl-5-hydroxy-6-metoxy-1,4-benzoquinol methylase